MEKLIKINKELNFGFSDLMLVVDFSEAFTLRDVLEACSRSTIDINSLKDILRCNYIEDYIKEANLKSCKDNQIEYLEIYWWGTSSTYDGVTESGSSWGFHGVGKKGKMGADVRKYGKFTKEEKANYREKYAIEITPIYKLAGLPIRIAKNMLITDYDKMSENSGDDSIKLIPSITLVEFLHAIFEELSFCGSIKQRDSFKKELLGRVKEIDKWKKDGTLDQHLIPWDKSKVVKKLKKQLKNL